MTTGGLTRIIVCVFFFHQLATGSLLAEGMARMPSVPQQTKSFTSYFLDGQGKAWAWGCNAYGQYGNGTAEGSVPEFRNLYFFEDDGGRAPEGRVRWNTSRDILTTKVKLRGGPASLQNLKCCP